ncbi:MAG TPA: hypothetical protein VMT59_07585 [Gaiellaceae bacterium]|nr:hypothetical protein [Gaiellaceae bacterium]
MATRTPRRSRSARVAQTLAAVAFTLVLLVHAAQTGNWLFVMSAIIVLLTHLVLTARASGRVRVGGGRLEVRRAGIPRRFPLSRLVSAEVQGRKLVLRSVDGKTVRVRLTGGPADAEILAQLREAASTTGVEIPDPPTRATARWPRIAGVVALACFSLGFSILIATEAGSMVGGRPGAASSDAQPLTPQLLASRNGTFTNPFERVATCEAYIVPLDVDSISHAGILEWALANHGFAHACVTHSLELTPGSLDPNRHQLSTAALLHQLRAVYRRAHGDTPAKVIGLTEFDLFSPTAPEITYVTHASARYGDQIFGVGSTARGESPLTLALAFSG